MRRKHSGIEAEILRAGATMFSERGYHATTLDALALAANISRATFYSYFPGKDALLGRLYHQVIGTTQASIERIAAQDLPAAEKLRQIIHFIVSYLATNTALMQVFFSELSRLPTSMSHSVAQANRAFCAVIEQVVEEGIGTGELIPLHPKRFTYMLLGACNWMYRWYRPGGTWAPEMIADEIIRIAEHGYLRPQAESGERLLLQEVRALRADLHKLHPSPMRPPKPARPMGKRRTRALSNEGEA